MLHLLQTKQIQKYHGFYRIQSIKTMIFLDLKKKRPKFVLKLKEVDYDSKNIRANDSRKVMAR